VTESYLAGAIVQAIERSRALSTVIDKPYPSAYDGLRTICSERLRGVVSTLRELQNETIVDEALQTPLRLRRFRRATDRLNEIETIGATALANADEGSSGLTRIVRGVCDELKYPLVPPTVANMSSSYLSIYSGFNLVLAPLLEGRFLLHLPDLYHELAHPFFDRENADRTVLDPYRDAFRNRMMAIKRHFAEQRHLALRQREPNEVIVYLHLWEWLWLNDWLEEFFCDAFAALTCGPAFGWAHYHLAAKVSGDLFDTPIGRRRSHPADDARARLILVALRQRGFTDEAIDISARWSALVDALKAQRPPEYFRCYPDDLLTLITAQVQQSTDDMGVTLATPSVLTSWPECLDEAWKAFWRNPQGYAAWEKNALKLGAGLS
jgi:hypothetical protein